MASPLVTMGAAKAITVAIPKLSVNVVSGQTTVLVVQDLGTPQHWAVGRASDCAVRIGDSTVSSHHLVIRAEPMKGVNALDEDGDPRYVWMFKDSSSSNGTYQGGLQVGGRHHPCPWIVIEGEDSVTIGHTHIRFDFDGQFTDPGTEIGEAKKATPAKAPTTAWEFASLILTGPPNTHAAAWWLFLILTGSAVFLALEWIQHR